MRSLESIVIYKLDHKIRKQPERQRKKSTPENRRAPETQGIPGSQGSPKMGAQRKRDDMGCCLTDESKRGVSQRASSQIMTSLYLKQRLRETQQSGSVFQLQSERDTSTISSYFHVIFQNMCYFI